MQTVARQEGSGGPRERSGWKGKGRSSDEEEEGVVFGCGLQEVGGWMGEKVAKSWEERVLERDCRTLSFGKFLRHRKTSHLCSCALLALCRG